MSGRFMAFAALAVAVVAGSTAARAQDLQPLSLHDAESRAVENHPQIRAGQYTALSAGEAVREIKSAYFPSVFASFTGAQAQNGSAIAAGALSNSTVLDRFAYGLSASQLLTDFGRTADLTASATLGADAQQQEVEDRRAIVRLNVDRAYFDALRAQAVMRVAEQTVSTRQTVVDQVTALAASGLKSALDLSFAKVNLSEAQLLLVQAKNDVQASYASLSAAMGTSQMTAYSLSDESLPGPPPETPEPLIAQALRDRPDVKRQRFAQESEVKFADAERALWFPTLSLAGVAGLTPYHQAGLNDRYSAIGLNITVPLTNGNLYSARRAAAVFQASAGQQILQDLENRVSRDVQVAWLDAQTAYQRLDLTNQLLAQANDALDLAEQRYNLGLSSIVELTQAQLNQTRGQIEQAAARYEYQSRTAALKFQMGALR